jgi:hypothetical protein
MAPQRLDELRTSEDLPLPPNTVDELRRDMARPAMACEQMKALEQAPLANWNGRREQGRTRWCVSSPTLLASASRQPTCWFRKCCPVTFAIDEQWPTLLTSPALLLRAVPGERGVGEVRQCPSEARLDPACLALPAVPEGQCARPVVPRADKRSGRCAEDEDDRGARPKAAHRVLAHGHGRRNPGRLHVAAVGLSRSSEEARTSSSAGIVTARAACWRFGCGVAEEHDERGIAVSYETVRRWVNHFGPMIAAHLRNRRPKPHAIWHLDEVYLKIVGRMVYLWHAVDAEGEVLDVLVQSKRNKHAALKLMPQASEEVCLRSAAVGHGRLAAIRRSGPRYIMTAFTAGTGTGVCHCVLGQYG